MARSNHEIDVEVRVLTDQFMKEMGKVDKQLAQMRRDWADDHRATRGYATKAEQILKSQASLSQQYALQGDQLRGLTQERKRLAELGLQETAQFKTLTNKITEVNKAYQLLGKRLHGANLEYNTYFNWASKLGRGAESLSKGFHTVSDALDGVERAFRPATIAVAGIGTAAFQAYKDYDSALTGVLKTTEFARPGMEKALEKFKDEIDYIAYHSPLSTGELLRTAEIGGQLGIAEEQLSDFAEVVNKLGYTTEMNMEQAALQMAQFANIMEMDKDKWLNFGSVVTELGNELATTEDNIIQFSHRLMGAGKVVGMSEADILGFSAAMGAAGLRVEAGGTNLSRTFYDIELATGRMTDEMEAYTQAVDNSGLSFEEMNRWIAAGGDEVEDFAYHMGLSVPELLAVGDAAADGAPKLEFYAEAAGMTREAFKQLWEEDPTEAFLQFIQGLHDLEMDGESLTAYLDDMGIKSQRQREVLVLLSESVDEVRRAVQMAKDEWADPNALEEEFSQYAESVQGQLDTMKNKIEQTARAIGEDLAPIVLDVLENISELVSGFKDLDEEQQQLIIKAGIAIGLIGPIAGALSGVTRLIGDGLGLAGKLLGAKGLGGIIGKAMTAKDELVKLGTAATGAKGLGGVATAAGGAAGGIGSIVLKLGAVAAAAKFAMDTFGNFLGAAKDTIDWINNTDIAKGGVFFGDSDLSMDPNVLAKTWKGIDAAADVLLPVGMSDLFKDGYKKAFMELSNAEIVNYDDTTKELVRKAQERMEAIEAVYDEAGMKDSDRHAELTKLQDERDEALRKKMEENYQKQLEFAEAAHERDKSMTKERSEELIQALEEEQRVMLEAREYTSKLMQDVIDEWGEADLQRRTELLAQKHDLELTWSAMEIDTYASSAEEKTRLYTESQRRIREETAETARELIQEAYDAMQAQLDTAESTYQSQRDYLYKLRDEGQITGNEFVKGLRAARDENESVTRDIESDYHSLVRELKGNIEGLQVSVDEATGQIKVSFDESAKSADNFGDRLANAASGSVYQIQRLVRELQVTQGELRILNDMPLKDKVATITYHKRMIDHGNYYNHAPTRTRQGISAYMSGIRYVPRNGHLAMLHEGERVLTKKENELYNEVSNEKIAATLERLNKKLDRQVEAQGASQVTNNYEIDVNLNDVVVKDDRDIRQLAKDLAREINKEVVLG